MDRKPIFLDRDGVINRDLSPYVLNAGVLEIFPWAVQALKLLNEAGFDIYVISNQQGVGKGMMSEQDLDGITQAIQDSIQPHGFQIKDFFYCTALAAENSPNRKPGSGMLYQARDKHHLTLEGSYFIGDKESDMTCGRNAGCRTVLLYTGVTAPGDSKTWEHAPEFEFENLLEAVKHIVQENSCEKMG